MLEIKLILCPVDFSEFSVRAYRHALSLAEHYGAKLVALNIVELSRYPYADYAASAGDYDALRQSLIDGGRERLQEFVTKHTHDEIPLELIVHKGVAPDCILWFAQERKADLIVMGTHGRRGFDRLVLGSVTNRVMRTASCPVLVVCNPTRESTDETEPGHVHHHHLGRILYCTDFSQNSEQALNYALSVRSEYDAELTMLHVLEEAPGDSKAEEVIAAATARVDKLIATEERKGQKIKTAVRIGKPYQQIIQYIQENQIDLVAMGVHGRGTLDVAVFGSTTYRVMQLGPCPVLAVPV